MSLFQIIILISAIAISLLIIFGLIKWKWGIDKVANIVTIYGVAVAVALIIKLSPQLVSIEEKPKIELHSFRANEWAYWKGRGGPDFRESDVVYKDNITEAYITGYISNIGTAIESNIALEFKFLAGDTSFKPWNCFLAYVFPDPDSRIPPIRFLHWTTQIGGTDILRFDEANGWARLSLPPIPPDNSVGIAIGFSEDDATKFEIVQLKHMVTDKVSVRIIKKGDSKPVWNPDRSSIKNYQEKLATPDVTLDSCCLEFFMDTSYSR